MRIRRGLNGGEKEKDKEKEKMKVNVLRNNIRFTFCFQPKLRIVFDDDNYVTIPVTLEKKILDVVEEISSLRGVTIPAEYTFKNYDDWKEIPWNSSSTVGDMKFSEILLTNKAIKSGTTRFSVFEKTMSSYILSEVLTTPQTSTNPTRLWQNSALLRFLQKKEHFHCLQLQQVRF